MKRRLLSITIILLVILSGLVYSAEEDINKELFFRIFQIDSSMLKDLFDSSMLEQVPEDKLIEIVKLYKDKLGSLIEVTGTEGNYTLVFKQGTVPAKIVVNSDQKIIGFWLGMWTFAEDSLESILTELKKLEDSVSVCIMKNNQEVLLDYHHNNPMAVGSSFKLYVLRAAYDAIEAGNFSWDSAIWLNQENKSLPSGMLQDWPNKTPVTIKTLTNLMISISDNTATDHLIEYLGRENIEKYITSQAKPFLKTVEAFKIKYSLSSQMQERYLQAELDEKRSILKELKNINLELNQFTSSPTLIEEVEWFFTTKELCQTIYSLKEAEEIKINPGLVAKENWHLAGYKGGSEPGVLQYTQVLQKTAADPIYTISITINRTDDVVDSVTFTELTVRLISLLEKGQL